MRSRIELGILYLACLIIGAFFLSSCGAKKVFVKNCDSKGQSVYECEEI